MEKDAELCVIVVFYGRKIVHKCTKDWSIFTCVESYNIHQHSRQSSSIKTTNVNHSALVFTKVMPKTIKWRTKSTQQKSL